MKYTIRGKGTVSLAQTDFICQGGEGKVYGKGDTAYKIYDDPKKRIPEAKIAELNRISHDRVIRPADVLLDARGRYVGFTMAWIRNCVPLARLFTTDFRNRNGISDEDTRAFIAAAIEAVRAVHRAGCLMVDGNEFNYLVDAAAYRTPYLIDVNSYQTPSFPATAIMSSIRDPHAAGFSELTDWFSFAVVACQLYAGVHPFKGKHPDYTRKKLGADLLKRRMVDNVSIFNPNVSLPPAARNLDRIPSNFRDWFVALFEKGRRAPPPDAPGAAAPPARTARRVVHATPYFDIRKLKTFKTDILAHRVVYGVPATRTRSRLHIGDAAFSAGPETEVVFTPRSLAPILARIRDGRLVFGDVPGRPGRVRGANLAASEIMVVENTLWARNGGDLTELAVVDLAGGDALMAVKSTWGIMAHASTVLDGLLYQSVLGKPYLVVPLPGTDGPSRCVVRHVPELTGYRVVQGRYENCVCMLLAHGPDGYRRFVFIFDAAHAGYACRIEDEVEGGRINFTVLDNGVVVGATDSGAMEIFRNRPTENRVEIVRDPALGFDMTLCRDGAAARFFRGNTLYAIRRKG